MISDPKNQITYNWALPDQLEHTGWVPESYLRIDGEKGLALRNYSSAELSVKKGELVYLVESMGGWTWVLNANGNSGWVPDEKIAVNVSES